MPFVVPPRPEGPPSAAELAGWFRLDADALCAANSVTPAACAGHAFAPGQVAVLTLGRGTGAATASETPAARQP